jgi:serine/threonine protein kinase
LTKTRSFSQASTDATWSSKSDEGCDFEVGEVGNDTAEAIQALLNECKPEPWQPSDFIFSRTLQLAPANHGRVDLMRCPDRGNYYAVKRMPLHWMTKNHANFKLKRTRSREDPWLDICMVKFLHDQSYPYVCEPLGVFASGSYSYVVTSFARSGDLFGLIHSSKLGELGPQRESWVRPLAHQIFTAVRMLHDLGIAHRDISPENIVLDPVENAGQQSWKVQLIDFGVASSDRWCKGSCGKAALEAPEIHTGNYFDAFLADAFALGAVLFSMTAKHYPWSSTKPRSCSTFSYVERHGLRKFCQKRLVDSDKNRTLIDVLNPSVLSLLEGLLRFEPSSRVALGEACWSECQVDVHYLEGCSIDELNDIPSCRESAFESDWFKEQDLVPDVHVTHSGVHCSQDTVHCSRTRP